MSFPVLKIFALVLVTHVVKAKVYFKERFPDECRFTYSWESNWVYSEHPGLNNGKSGEFKLTAGEFYNAAQKDEGIQTTENSTYYALSRKFTPFSNKNKTLVIQLTVKHEQNIDCGGGFVKLFDCSLDQKNMYHDSPYIIMFGPDICGPKHKIVHVIWPYKGKNLLIDKEIKCKDDVYTHLYTLVVKPDNTYEVLIDNKKVESGDLESDWKFLPPKKIKDPAAKKPIDYKGVWVPPEIDNPKYSPDPNLYLREEICAIGIELWQVKSGTIFDNIMITDDVKVAKEFGNAVWKPMFEGEKRMKEAYHKAKEEQKIPSISPSPVSQSTSSALTALAPS